MGGLSEFHGWRRVREREKVKEKYETKGKSWGGIISVGVSRRGGVGWGVMFVAPNPTLQFATTSRHWNIHVVICLFVGICIHVVVSCDSVLIKFGDC
jgi:hypothetical protein